MEQSMHTAINWMTRGELELILETNGFAVYSYETDDELRDAVRENVDDGTIPDYVIA